MTSTLTKSALKGGIAYVSNSVRTLGSTQAVDRNRVRDRWARVWVAALAFVSNPVKWVRNVSTRIRTS
jgi:hypothetical protein